MTREVIFPLWLTFMSFLYVVNASDESMYLYKGKEDALHVIEYDFPENKDNPDFRLGQLITVAARPSNPHPTTFYIEDDKMLEGLKSFGEQKTNNETSEPLWIKHSVIGKAEMQFLQESHLDYP